MPRESRGLGYVLSLCCIVGRWGVAELGRFAVDCKNLFGESPSTTSRSRLARSRLRLVDTIRGQRGQCAALNGIAEASTLSAQPGHA